MFGSIKSWILAKGLQFGIQLGDTLAQGSGGVLDLSGGVAWGDEFRAVPIVAEDVDDEDPPDLRAVAAGRDDFLDELGMFADIEDFGMAEDLHPFALGVIHHEKRDAIMLRDASDTDHLTIPTVVGEADLSWPEHADKAVRPAAMLDIRPIVLGYGRHVEAVAGFDEFDFLFA
jgi:hypothetical protein